MWDVRRQVHQHAKPEIQLAISHPSKRHPASQVVPVLDKITEGTTNHNSKEGPHKDVNENFSAQFKRIMCNTAYRKGFHNFPP